MAAQTCRHWKRSSSHVPRFTSMSASLDVKRPVFDLRLKAVERTRRRAGDHASVPGKNSVVARAEELALLGDPSDTAAEVSTDIGEGGEILPVLGQDVGGNLLLGVDPSGL